MIRSTIIPTPPITPADESSMLKGLIIAALISFALCDWPGVSTNRSRARRSQRDVSWEVPIDELSFVGVHLNAVIFNPQGYTTESLEDVRNLLRYGVSAVSLDLYWDEYLLQWQLCPARIPDGKPSGTIHNISMGDGQHVQCQNNLTASALIAALRLYAQETQTYLNADLVEVVLHLHSLPFSGSTDVSAKISSGGSSVKRSTTIQSLGSLFNYGLYFYTPRMLSIDRQSNLTKTGYPTLHNVILQKSLRMIAMVGSNQMAKNSTYSSYMVDDTELLFIPGITPDFHPVITSLSSDTVGNSSEHFSIIYDNNDTRFDQESLTNALAEGFTPILNSTSLLKGNLTSSASELSEYDLWSWAPSQPGQSESIGGSVFEDTQARFSNRQVSYSCAVLYDDRWTVSNCYNSFPIACQHEKDSLTWNITTRYGSFFDAEDLCPDDYFFSVPSTPLEQEVLMQKMRSSDIVAPVWISMNSVTAIGCWVRGGPSVACPYQKRVSRDIFIRMMVPVASVTLALLLIILLLQFDTVPIHRNRKHWKKLVEERTANDYDGVPS